MEKSKAKHHEKDGDLKKLKESYSFLEKKYNLPEFKFLNENFEIEQISSEDTELLLKRIRKQMTEKISSGLRALEMFLNPQNSPLFIFNILKSFSQSDKELIQELYKKFSWFEIEAFGLENSYNEEKEAQFIRDVSKEWKEISYDFNKLYETMKIGHKQDSKKNEKSYLG